MREHHKIIESLTTVQCDLFRRFNIHRKQPVPNRIAILHWVHALHIRGTPIKSSSVRAPRVVRTPDKMERVRQALLFSPNSSARRHATEPGIDNRSISQINT